MGTTATRDARGGTRASSSDSDDDDDARDDDDSPLLLSKTRLFAYGVLVRNLRFPPWLARLLVSVSAGALAKLVAWVLLSQAFAYLEHAPLFLLLTGFYLIFTGLGTRRAGEVSRARTRCSTGSTSSRGPSTPRASTTPSCGETGDSRRH